MNLDQAFDEISTRQHNTLLSTVTSIDLLTRAMVQDKYTRQLALLVEHAYELLDRQSPINLVQRTSSHHGSSGRHPSCNEAAKNEVPRIEQPRVSQHRAEGSQAGPSATVGPTQNLSNLMTFASRSTRIATLVTSLK